jgi:hypothetical protein
VIAIALRVGAAYCTTNWLNCCDQAITLKSFSPLLEFWKSVFRKRNEVDEAGIMCPNKLRGFYLPLGGDEMALDQNRATMFITRSNAFLADETLETSVTHGPQTTIRP